jgi:hypothetical protein
MNERLLSHKAVHYRAATNKQRRCGVCSMYVNGRNPRCTLVQSPIRAYDVCDKFQPKGKDDAARQ